VLKGQGIKLGHVTIRKIIRATGFKWRKARTVLTSTDPQYREKVDRIKAVLSKLGPRERFFSIDEFGPFAIKMRSGLVLCDPHKVPVVPQFQKSKGSLIVTAALELSTNQVTHFYSQKKDTEEMIKLLDVPNSPEQNLPEVLSCRSQIGICPGLSNKNTSFLHQADADGPTETGSSPRPSRGGW
jgi:hypothetical protein